VFLKVSDLPKPPLSFLDIIFQVLYPFRFTFFGLLLEIQGNGIDAEAFSRRFRPVIKDMTQVSSAAGTDGLDPVHEKAVIFLKPDFVAGNHIIETGPAGPGLELGIGRKEFLPAGGTGVDALFLVIIQLTRKRSLGAFLPQNVILFRSKNLFPFLFWFLYFIFCQLQTPFMHRTQLCRKYYNSFGQAI